MPSDIVLIVGVFVGILLSIWIIGERGRLLFSSTWSFMKSYKIRDLLNFKAVHGYVYGRWTTPYIYVLRNFVVPRLGERGKKLLSDSYHGKVMTHDRARSVITVNRTIPLQDLEQVIPYPAARDLVLHSPPDIVAYECCCRNSKSNHCSPTQVCMVIGKPFTDFLLDHQPQKARRLTQEEALELLKQEHERGHMHSAWFKDSLLNRFYSLCNCCSCCCMGTEAMHKFGATMLSPSGFVAHVDASKCKGCGACAKACHFRAINVVKTADVAWDACMGCGVCEVKCPSAAVSLVRDAKKGEPFDIRKLA